MRIVQVCNVGNICGGTAACAWSITRALPECRHTICFLSAPTSETRDTFLPVEVRQIRRVDDRVLAPFQPDLVILHNTAAVHVDSVRQSLCLQYMHSRGHHAPADLTVACSKWLALQFPHSVPILDQPVPLPPGIDQKLCTTGSRAFDDQLIVGRICTPQARKWPESSLAIYHHLAPLFPEIRWEFVGCPHAFEPQLQTACRGRAKFWPAGWEARRHLLRWHALLYHHPTLTESFGRTCAEAMRAGCIPVVDDRGGFSEQIQSGRTGFLCRNITEFTAALAALTPSQRWLMSQAGRSAANARFSLRTFATRFRQLLSSLS